MSRLPDLMKLQALCPDDPDLLFMIAQEHVNDGCPAEALPWLARYVELGSDVGAGHRLAATCQARLGDLEAARASFETGIAAALAGGHPTLAQEMREDLDELDELDDQA